MLKLIARTEEVYKAFSWGKEMSFIFPAKRLRQKLMFLRLYSGQVLRHYSRQTLWLCLRQVLQIYPRQVLFYRIGRTATLIFLMLLLFLSASCRKAKEPTRKTTVPSSGKTETSKQADIKKSDEQKTTVKITLYFADSQAEYLVSEVREVSYSQSLEEVAVKELIKGPQNQELAACIPKGTELHQVRLEEGIAYVDFSQELISKYPGGSAAETMTIYSVVNTLAEFPQIKAVKFLVEGKPISALGGHYDMSQAFEPKLDLVKESSK